MGSAGIRVPLLVVINRAQPVAGTSAWIQFVAMLVGRAAPSPSSSTSDPRPHEWIDGTATFIAPAGQTNKKGVLERYVGLSAYPLGRRREIGCECPALAVCGRFARLSRVFSSMEIVGTSRVTPPRRSIHTGGWQRPGGGAAAVAV